MRSSIYRIPALLLVLVLAVAACTGDDDDAVDTTAVDTASDTTAVDTASDTTAVDAAGATTAAPDGGAAGESLATVIANDVVRCGTRDALPGFAVLTPEGEHEGFDSDFCRVIAAAVLGDATKVEHIDLETADRFTALQSGQIDVLVRNTTWTAQRDGTEGADFLATTYFDGQGMMVAADSVRLAGGDGRGHRLCRHRHHHRGQRRRRGGTARGRLGGPPLRRHGPDPGGVHRRSVRRVELGRAPSSSGCARPIRTARRR